MSRFREASLPHSKGSCGVKTGAVVFLFSSGLEPRGWLLISGAVQSVGAGLWVSVEPHMTFMVSDLLQRLNENSLTFWSGYYGEQSDAALGHPFNWETRLAG
jgi:hypothetical protein